MKKVILQFINKTVANPEMIPAVLSKNNVISHSIDTVNWPEYPYRPLVSFRMAYTQKAFLLHFIVNEKHIKGRYTNDNDPVWTDSCVEFFCQPFEDGLYYNIECNCLGTILFGVGGGRHNRELASPEITKQIKRWSSLGKEPFEHINSNKMWEVAIRIPFTVFWKHDFSTRKISSMKANFYKCGDELITPHFLSWNPIKVENPDFHRPEYFGKLLSADIPSRKSIVKSRTIK